MGYFSQKTQIIIWLMVLIPVIAIWVPNEYFKPSLDFLLLAIISISVGVVLMFYGSYKRIQEIKVNERAELQRLKNEYNQTESSDKEE